MIKKPTLLIDKSRCLRNIEMMVNKARAHNISLRPHFKTHQSHVVGRWFKDQGIHQCTVSSVSMAQHFSQDGWNDITIAFPTNILEINEINELASLINLNLLVESSQVLAFLGNNLKYPVGIFLNIDLGYHRSGLNPAHTDSILSLLSVINQSEKMNAKGFLSHAGHSYDCRSEACIRKVYADSMDKFMSLKESVQDSYPDLIFSYGDTPTCSVVEDLSDLDEIRPGNFVYYDLTQKMIGSCEVDQIAVAIACPVVSIHPHRNEVVVYGGGVHFSKDRMDHPDYGMIYGIPVESQGDGWSSPILHSFLKKISQEHGTIRMPESEISKLHVGDIIKILPIHSCMAADLLKTDFTVV